MKALKTIDIKGKNYVEVKTRIQALAEERDTNQIPYDIETDYQYIDSRKMWIVKAKLTWNGNIYTGLAQEIESENYKEVNFTSALENCETSAVGRACAMAGIGITDGIASADEVKKAISRGSQFNAEKNEGGEHTCKKCGVINPSTDIKTGQYGEYFKCSECGQFSKPNPTNTKDVHINEQPF